MAKVKLPILAFEASQTAKYLPTYKVPERPVLKKMS
jgi:hypothetical protein